MGVGGVELPPDRFRGMSYEEAKQAFEAEPPVRVLFENGGGDGSAGRSAPDVRGQLRGVAPAGDGGHDVVLRARRHAHRQRAGRRSDGADSYEPDPSSRPETTPSGRVGRGGVGAHAAVHWEPLAGRHRGGVPQRAARRPTPSMVGTGSVDLWVRRRAEDTDLQVTITEVRPDGKEIYVQNGWLRASHRASTARARRSCSPRHTHPRPTPKPLPAGKFTLVRVELFPFGARLPRGLAAAHQVEAPGGDRPRWRFGTLDTDGVTNTIARSVAHPSRVVLPVVTGVEVPPGAPACGLRGQPCRDYVAPDGG